jgi:hypothetical protein
MFMFILVFPECVCVCVCVQLINPNLDMKFSGLELQGFCPYLPTANYPALRSLAAVFGSTKAVQQFQSLTDDDQTKRRSRFTDGHFETLRDKGCQVISGRGPVRKMQSLQPIHAVGEATVGRWCHFGNMRKSNIFSEGTVVAVLVV